MYLYALKKDCLLMKKYYFLISLLFLFNLSFTQRKEKTAENFQADKSLIIQKNLSDSALLDLVQKQTIKYFWDFAHPVSGMARERSNESFDYGNEVVTTGGTGFGVMALIVGVERKWLPGDSVVENPRRLPPSHRLNLKL